MRHWRGLNNGGRKGFGLKKYRGQAAALLCLAVVLCCFAFRKEGYHMDELLSFELSNAEYNPWIVPTQPVGRLAKFMKEEIEGDTLGETLANLADTALDVLENRGESKLLQYRADVYPEPVWIEAEAFREYLTTGKGDRFNYFSVYFNVKDDNHPPLHFMLLHTMSSLFPGVIVPFLGCFINILAILGSAALIFALGALLEEGGILPAGWGEVWGICAGLFYGLSSGGIATALLIRMYGVMSFFCVALFYLQMRKWIRGSFSEGNRLLAAVTVLGFLTQYFFLFYCIALFGVTAVLLILEKRYRELKAYTLTMVCAGAAGVALFPFSVQDVLSSGRGQEALQNLGRGFSGYGERLWAFGRILLERCFGSPAAGLAALLLLLAAWVILGRRLEKGGAKGRVWILLLVPAGCYFLLAARMSPYLVDRYIMPLFAFAAMAVTLLWVRLAGLLGGRPYIALLPVAVFVIFQTAGYDGEYLYQGYEKQEAVAVQYGELPCVCVYDGAGYYENLIEFTRYERTLLTTLPQLGERQDISGGNWPEQLVVLRKGNVEEKQMLDVFAGYGWEVREVLLEGEESVYGDTLYLCGRSVHAGVISGD